MGATKTSICFMQIIDHTSVNLYRIPTKLCAVIRLNDYFTCAKFQLDQSKNLCFMADFAKCVKRRVKKPKLLCSYLRNDWGNFLQMSFADSLPCGHFCSKFGSFQ